jgi:hypothetical protein
MEKLSKRTLSLLSLLVIVGFAIVGITIRSNFIFLGYAVILIGSMAFGTLLYKEK